MGIKQSSNRNSSHEYQQFTEQSTNNSPLYQQDILHQFKSSVLPAYFNLKNWMSHLQDRPLMSLTLPGTHNSGTYQPHNFLWVIKNYMLCQDKSVYEQLKMGVRVLDIRGSKYYAPNQRNIHVANYLKHGEPEQNDNNQKRKKMFRYYIGHTLICVPLDQVIFDIQKFIYKNPTEVIIVLLRTDFAVFNADFKYLSHNSQQNRSRVKKIKNKEMSDFIDYFINGVGRDKFMLHDFTYSTKIRKITSQNKNIVLFVDGKLYPKSTIENKCSWSDTIHHKPRINISLCKSWCDLQPHIHHDLHSNHDSSIEEEIKEQAQDNCQLSRKQSQDHLADNAIHQNNIELELSPLNNNTNPPQTSLQDLLNPAHHPTHSPREQPDQSQQLESYQVQHQSKEPMKYFNQLTVQVTLEKLNKYQWVKEVITNIDGGLRKHALSSNKLLEEWLTHEEDRVKLRKINGVMLDFSYSEVCNKIIQLNFEERKKV
eukprot:403338349